MKTDRTLLTMVAAAMLFSSLLIAGGDKCRSSYKVGDRVDNFTLKDFNGVETSLAQFKSKKAIVLMFISTECPNSNGYNDRMVRLVDDYGKKGVQFIAINSNKEENESTIAAHARKYGFNFPVLKDWKNVIADRFAASVTPEVYLLNASDYSILYHGRIDDNYRVERINSHDLRTTLDEVLSNKQISHRETKAFGCSIKRG